MQQNGWLSLWQSRSLDEKLCVSLGIENVQFVAVSGVYRFCIGTFVTHASMLDPMLQLGKDKEEQLARWRLIKCSS